jgi:hypothetical protein
MRTKNGGKTVQAAIRRNRRQTKQKINQEKELDKVFGVEYTD